MGTYSVVVSYAGSTDYTSAATTVNFTITKGAPTVTVTDPKYYTKAWTWMRANFYWMKAQEFSESLCIPSEAIAYRDTLARPSGINAR